MLGPTAEAALVALPVAAWWAVGLSDIRQTRHTIRRNFPVLGNVRYALETVRPEIRYAWWWREVWAKEGCCTTFPRSHGAEPRSPPL